MEAEMAKLLNFNTKDHSNLTTLLNDYLKSFGNGDEGDLESSGDESEDDFD